MRSVEAIRDQSSNLSTNVENFPNIDIGGMQIDTLYLQTNPNIIKSNFVSIPMQIDVRSMNPH
ncbi:hypothetical protein KY285_029870 [Solanum tuberosum]|nr:hypothetical protein KY285_029870 [Solanum tuberosum]